MTTPKTFVVIGAGLAGAKAVETLREEGYDGRIVLVGEEKERPYNRPPLSKGYLAGNEERDSIYVLAPDWYTRNDVELRVGRRATLLSPADRTVTVDGYDQLQYDKLLLATGSTVNTLDVPGADLTGIRYLRTVEQSDALLAGLHGGGRVVVIGAGWIGLEVAAAARGHGCPVTVVEMDSLPLRRVLGDEAGAVFADLHREHEVDFRFGTGVTEFLGEGTVTGVRLSDGSVLPADLVVIGVGIRPAVELAEVAGLAVDNGIVTDQHLRTSDEHVYACGDVANSYRPWLDRRVRVEHWSNALDGGAAAARAMLGKDGPDGYDQVPYFFTDQYDLGMEYAGFVEPGGYDEVVFRGDAGKREFIAFWLRDGRVLAGMNVNVWDVNEHIQALVRSGQAVDRAQLADPAVPLESLAPAG